MSWLFPIYLAGAAAIIAPILLHLRRKPPQDRVEFSTLMFLDASTPVPVSKRRLENWLLLALLSAMGHDLVLFHLMDRAEIDFTFEKSAYFRDAETGAERFIDPLLVRENYLKRLQAHREAVLQATERHNVEYHFCPTDQPLEEVLFNFLSARQRKKASKSAAARVAV